VVDEEDKELTLMIPDSSISNKTTSRIMLNVARRKDTSGNKEDKVKYQSRLAAS